MMKRFKIKQNSTYTIYISFIKFRWNDRFHGKTSVAFWIWIEDPESDMIYHWEQFLITKKQV